MKYLPTYKDLTNISTFFCANYKYNIEQESKGIESMGCAYIILNNKKLPKLKIEMELYILDLQVLIDNDYVSLLSIYKFFHPKEILRNYIAYRRKKIFINKYIEDQNKYFIDYSKRKDDFNFNEFHTFYEKYPLYVWRWN